MMRKSICPKCEVALVPDTNGVTVAETMNQDRDIYRIWQADMLRCPGCGVKMIVGFGQFPVEHFQTDFASAKERFEKARAEGKGFFWKERVKGGFHANRS